MTADTPTAPSGFTWKLHCDGCGQVLPSPRAWPAHLLSDHHGRAEQLDLTGGPPLDQESAKLHRDPSTTSLEAARKAARLSPGARRRVLARIVRAGDQGIADHELAEELTMNPSTVRPRRLELVEARYVKDSGGHTLTPSGSRAACWIATPEGVTALYEARLRSVDAAASS